MFRALLGDNDEFVQLFLDNGVHLAKFLTVKKLARIYAASLNDRSNTMCLLFRNLTNKTKAGRAISFFVHGKTTYDSRNRTYKYCNAKLEQCFASMSPSLVPLLRNLQNRNRLLCFCSRGDDASTHDWDDGDAVRLLAIVGSVIGYLLANDTEAAYMQGLADTRRSPPVSLKGSKKDPEKLVCLMNDFIAAERELFIWALLFNKRTLAKIFWNMCSDPVGGALVASRLLKTLSAEAAKRDEVDLSLELQSDSRYSDRKKLFLQHVS